MIKFQVRAPPGKEEENAPPVFDAEHEAKRKEQLLKLYNRTPEQVNFYETHVFFNVGYASQYSMNSTAILALRPGNLVVCDVYVSLCCLTSSTDSIAFLSYTKSWSWG